MFYLISESYQKLVKIKDIQFCMESLKMKMKRKTDKFFWPSGAGVQIPDFLKFQQTKLNYWSWWNQIQAKKLKFLNFILYWSIRQYDITELWIRGSSLNLAGMGFDKSVSNFHKWK